VKLFDSGGLTALASTRMLGANDTLRVGVTGAGSALYWSLPTRR
jgi:hypothetical protein